jgi:CRP/FNR family cyclic AMP-dependent transcriptional regulator
METPTSLSESSDQHRCEKAVLISQCSLYYIQKWDYNHSMLINEGKNPKLFNDDSLPSSVRYNEILQKMSSIKEQFGITRPEELYSVFDNIIVQTFQAGNVIFSPSSTHEQIYVLKEGRVDLYQISTDGKRLSIGHLVPGGVFGVRSVLSRSVNKNFAEAAVDSIVYIITKQQFLTYLKHQPEVTIRMLEAAYENLSFAEERLMRSSYSSAKVRIAYFLLTNSDPNSGIIANVTHEEIGNNIGAVRETVTEILNLMRLKGLIKIKRRQIQLVDRNGLAELLKE